MDIDLMGFNATVYYDQLVQRDRDFQEQAKSKVRAALVPIQEELQRLFDARQLNVKLRPTPMKAVLVEDDFKNLKVVVCLLYSESETIMSISWQDDKWTIIESNWGPRGSTLLRKEIHDQMISTVKSAVDIIYQYASGTKG